MKKYMGMRSIKEVKKNMSELGYAIDQNSEKEFKRGDDYLLFGNFERTVLLNGFNGVFFVHDMLTGENITSSSHTKYEDETWFKELLTAIYKEVDEA